MTNNKIKQHIKLGRGWSVKEIDYVMHNDTICVIERKSDKSENEDLSKALYEATYND